MVLEPWGKGRAKAGKERSCSLTKKVGKVSRWRTGWDVSFFFTCISSSSPLGNKVHMVVAFAQSMDQTRNNKRERKSSLNFLITSKHGAGGVDS